MPRAGLEPPPLVDAASIPDVCLGCLDGATCAREPTQATACAETLARALQPYPPPAKRSVLEQLRAWLAVEPEDPRGLSGRYWTLSREEARELVAALTDGEG